MKCVVNLTKNAKTANVPHAAPTNRLAVKIAAPSANNALTGNAKTKNAKTPAASEDTTMFPKPLKSKIMTATLSKDVAWKITHARRNVVMLKNKNVAKAAIAKKIRKDT